MAALAKMLVLFFREDRAAELTANGRPRMLAQRLFP